MHKKELFELTNPQKNIWNTELFFSDTNVNNVCVSGILNEVVNFEILKEAINILVEKNDSFRIHLSIIENVPMQTISTFVPFNIDVLNVNSKSEFISIEQSMVNEKFTLMNSNLFKFKLAKFPDGRGGVILNVHHIISDSWSLGLTIQEIIKIYHYLLEGNSEYISNTFSYKNLIVSEQDYKNSTRYHNDKEFWNSYLKDFTEPVSIPSINRNTYINSSKAKRLSFNIEHTLVKQISEFCNANRISNYSFFMSILALYIANVSNINDLIIGTPILNRLNYKDKLTMGMFVTTMPFRVSLNPTDTFIDFALSNNVNLVSLLRHQKYPYSDILEGIRQSTDIPNLYNVSMSYQITKAVLDDIGDYETNWTFNNNCLNDINIHLYDINDTGNLKIDYDFLTDKYSDDEINSIHLRIINMINQILSNHSILLSNVEIVTPEEKAQILHSFNNKTLECPFNKNIIKLFEEQVNLHPDNIALVYKEEKYTYRELNSLANKFARFLKNYGVAQNDIVGVYMNKNSWFIICILAIQKLGAAYLPMHPEYPQDRVNYILDDSKSKLLITDQTIDTNIPVITNPENQNLTNYDSSNLNIDFSSDNLCYVIYTSGSTGNPKGVMLSHSNLINFIYNFNDCFNHKFSSDDICLSLTNISFDVSVCEIYTPLLFGASLVIYPNNTLTDIRLLCDILEKEHITFLYIPPSMLLDVYNFIKSNNCKFSVNKILVGVETIKNSTLNNLLTLNPNLEILNGYGPTETTICATFYKYKYNENDSEVVPIGFPLKNNDIFILNIFNNLQPIGCPGELCVSGKNVSVGYLNNPEITKKSFENIEKYENRLFYKTGDIAVCNNNGYLNFIGRQDSQIKFRGHRVELNEINNKIKNIYGINNSITLFKEINKIPSICCYISLLDSSITSDYIKEILQKTLPYYMIPNHIVILDNLPINKNGKIDKKSLPEIKIYSSEIEEPSSLTEIKLHQILCKLLNLDKISINDNLFNLGMDSLICIRLSLEIYNIFNKNITIKDLFKYTTIYELSNYIDTCDDSYKSDDITIAPDAYSYPLSSAQKRIYFASSLGGKNSILYNLPGGIILDTIPDAQKLEDSFNKLIEKHESLRTYFELVDGNVVQKIVDKINFKLNVSSKNYKDLNKCFRSFVKPFNLNSAPLIRAELVKFENGKSLLLFDMHHIISDGTSLNILIKDLSSLYNGEKLKEENLTYKDFAVWENNNLKNSIFSKSKEYWMSQFKDEIPLLDMPTNYPRPSQKSFEGSKIYKTINAELTNKINEFALNNKTTPYMVLLSAYYILLSKYSLQNDIIVGSPIVGRDNTRLSNIMGMFVNTLPLRMKISDNSSFKEFLNSVKTMCLQNFEHQTYPLDELVNTLEISRDLSRNPLFDVLFVYQNGGMKDLKLGNIKAKYYIPDTKISKFDLSLEIVPENDIFNINFEYCTKLFNEDFIQNLSEHYINILKNIIEDSNIKINEITMLSEQEKNKILYEFNNTITDYPRDSNIISLFEEQVIKNPNKIAVVFEDQKLTYEQLNIKANQLANAILNQGVTEGSVIALLMDKSLEMIVSIIAVLKTNCAFLPIDTSYPKERIDYMLKDSDSKLLITAKHAFNNIDYAINILNIDINETSIFGTSNTNNYSMSYSSNNLAYIMYTSGSTGTPKGVMVRQKSIIRLVKNSNFIKYNSEEHILQSGSIVFDASTFEIWSALLNGFELYIIKKEDLLNADTLQNYLLKNKITILWLTAPLFNQLIEENPYMFNTVHYLLTGGDVLSPKHINMARAANPNLKIINGYGPTENTTFSTCFTIDKTYENNIPIGYPIANSTCYVCSSNGNLVPIGVPGELYVGGDGLAIGYLNNPSLTNDKFINFTYTNDKVYKTGDLVRWLPDGSIEFLGRIDSQIKIRGFRVELNEINLGISKYNGIKECTTIVQQINNQKTICCYYVSKDTIDLNNLKNYLKTFLPSYMIPSYFIKLDKLPINTNGKVDKNSLPTNFNKTTSSLKIEKPRNNTEKLILDIYKKVLNIEEISVTDDFFEIGGDSLSAMKLQVEFMANDLDISYADLFKYSSIQTISDFINSNKVNEETEYLDYKKYDELLKYNTIDNINKMSDIKPSSIGNVFLTGFTGFLGAHVLDSFMKNTESNIYCLIRGKNNLSALDRLKNILHFYFDDKYDKYIGNRINLVEGDISKDNLALSTDTYNSLGSNINTVIHCAALVKHFGTYKDFENINILGTQKVIDFCKKFNLRLLHISTISVSGNAFAEDSYIENNFSKDVNYDETNFYIGQNLNNLYVKSKFMAEKLVLDAISNGLEACILRMGNLTSRFSEGKFQQNHFENAFVNRFKSILQIKYAPDYLLSGYVEFTPIDFSADAIIKLACHFNKKFTVFHLLNEKIVTMDRLLSIFKDLNIDIHVVSSEQFKEIINNLLHNDDKKLYLEGIINDFNKDKELVYESPVKIKSDFTSTYLEKIGFSWPYIDKDYVYNYLKYLSDIGYFNVNLS